MKDPVQANDRLVVRHRITYTTLFLASLAYFLTFPHSGFVGMVPDNIAQTAYFSLLDRPHLVGSIGSASPKAGLIFLLGAAHYVSYELFQSLWPFKTMLALTFSATLFLVCRIAAALGGAMAGILALLVAVGSGYLTLTFITASSNLFFIPLVLSGLFLLSINRDRPGVLVLSLASTVRPEALIVIASILVFRTLPQRKWREAFEFSVYAALALAVYLGVAYWVQGSWDRVGGGAATGYPAYASLRTIGHVRETFGQFFGERFVALLLLPAAFALFRLPAARPYAFFFSMILVFLVLMASGLLALHYRYIASCQAIVFAVGSAGLFLNPGQFREPDEPARNQFSAIFGIFTAILLSVAYWSTNSIYTPLTMLSIPAVYALAIMTDCSRGESCWFLRCRNLVCVVLGAMALFSMVHLRQQLGPLASVSHPAVEDATEFLNDPVVTPGARIISEDELLNYVIAKRPDFLGSARSIQSFNVMPDEERRRELMNSDYLYVSKRHNYGWNYLFYFPRGAWHQDRFRQVVHKMIADEKPQRILGVALTPVYNSETRFIARLLQIEDDGPAESNSPGGQD